MDRISLSFGLAVGFEFLRTCSSFPVNNYRDALADGSTWIGVSVAVSLAFAVVGVLFLAGCLCCRREANGFKPNEQKVDAKDKEEFHNSVTNLSQAGLGFTNPNLQPPPNRGNELAIFPPAGVGTGLGAGVTFEPLPQSIQPPPVQTPTVYSKPPAFAANQTTQQQLDIADWFTVGKNANFPREQLHYLREYGRGWFGRVVEGEARGMGPNGANCKVVVRILREDATASEQKFFLNEVKTLRDLSHPNLLKLVATCLDTDPFLILLESCSSGDLKSFLCGNVASRSALCEQGICLRMMCDVANGLQHILQHGFVHTDLAARNCLVTSDLTVKVGDYGTSIEMYKDDYYIAGDVALPIRWCAPESLHCTDTTIETKQVTSCANVWSFGVVLWEVCEFGALPYTSLSDDQVIVRVLGNERLKLAPPTHPWLHTAHLYSLMQMCWNEEATRPSLDHVIAMLRHLQLSRTADSDDNFERRWETLKPNTIPVTDNRTSSEALTIRSDFDSGVDLDLKASSDHDLKSSSVSNLESSRFDVDASNSDIRSSSEFDLKSSSHLDVVNSSSSDFDAVKPSAAGSPQLSVASSLGGDYFAHQLTRQLSPSLTNLRGSFEDVAAVIVTAPSHKPSFDFTNSTTTATNNVNVLQSPDDQFDSWLQGVDTTDEEEVKFVKNISEAIRDLDNRLAMEKTSSSSESSSRHESPHKEASVPQQNPVLDFRLGPISSRESRQPLLGGQLDSLQEDSLCVRRDSSSDTEEETWRGRIERGEFTEKVKEKSKSVADLMILTHIENSSDESDSLPSLTRQFSIEKRGGGARFGVGKHLAVPTMMTSIGFGSEGNIRGAVLGEEFQESLKLLQTAWKMEAESRQTSLTVDQVQNEPCAASSANLNDAANFLGDTASEKCLVVRVAGESSHGVHDEKIVESCLVALKTVENSGKNDVNVDESVEIIGKLSNVEGEERSSVENYLKAVENVCEIDVNNVNIEESVEIVGKVSDENEASKENTSVVEEGEVNSSKTTIKETQEMFAVIENEITKGPIKEDEGMVQKSEDEEGMRTQVIKSTNSPIQDDEKFLKKTENINEEDAVQRINSTSDFLVNERFRSEDIIKDIHFFQTVSEIQDNQKTVSNLTSPVSREEPNLSKIGLSKSEGNIGTSSNLTTQIDEPVSNLCDKQVEDHSITKDNSVTSLEASNSQKSLDLEKLDNYSNSQTGIDKNCESSSRNKREAPQFNYDEKEDSVEADKFLLSDETEENCYLSPTIETNMLMKYDNELSEKSMIDEFISRERGDVKLAPQDSPTIFSLRTPLVESIGEIDSHKIPVEIVNKIEEPVLETKENDSLIDEISKNEFEIMDSLPESERIYENELSDTTNKDSPDDVISDVTSFVQSPIDSSSGLLQDNLDSKETSLSELESSSQSSGQTMTVVENDPLRNEEVIPELASNSEASVAMNASGKLPEIVVTEALDIENVQINVESDSNVNANYEFKPRRQIRILIANDSSDDTDSENDCDVFDDSKSAIVVGSASQTTTKQQQDVGEGDIKTSSSPPSLTQTIQDYTDNVVREVVINKIDQQDDNEGKMKKLDLEKSFNTSDAINIFSLDEEGNAVDKLKAINVDLQVANVEDTKQTASNSNINESYSVILGSCEDYTLDYFKGLKTTSGKPGTFDSDYSTNELSKSDSEMEDTDVSSTDRDDNNINNWDSFLTNSLKDKVLDKEENLNVQFNNVQQLDSVGSSDVNSDDTVVDDNEEEEEEEESDRLNKKNLDLSRDNNNFINERNLNSRLLAKDYENRNSRIIQDRVVIFENGNGFQVNDDQDQKMNEIKSRLEDVAKLSEGFQLKKKVGEEEEEDEGKLLTPDDERSSDSGFRDKGSLSESVEDACDEKYNLEDIEAELEEAYTKTSTESKYFSLHDENSSSSGEFSALASFPTPSSSKMGEEVAVREEEEEVECLKEVKESKGGWFLHPHRGGGSTEEEDDGMSGWYPSPVTPELVKDESSRSFSLDEELNAIRNELQEKLACAQQVTRGDIDEDNSPEEEQRTDMVIEYGSYPAPLSPIMEERESVSSNQSSIILDLHSSNVSTGRSSPVLMLDRNDSFDDEDDEAGRKFEEDIRTALDLYSSDSVESDEVVDIIVEDLEDKEGTRKVVEGKQEEEEEDLLIVNTETNEAQLLESPRPKSHLAFVKKSKVDKNLSPLGNTYTPDSISPISTGSSRTGVALSFSSPDTGGNLSSFLSPSNSENVDSDYSVNNSLDLDVERKVKNVPIFFDHKEMFDKLKELEEESSDSSEMSSERTISVPGRSVQELVKDEEKGESEKTEESEEKEELKVNQGEEREVADLKLDIVVENLNKNVTNHEAVLSASFIREELKNCENFIEKEAIFPTSESNHLETSPAKNVVEEELKNGETINETQEVDHMSGLSHVKASSTSIDERVDMISDEITNETCVINGVTERNNVITSPTKNVDKEDLITVDRKEPISDEKEANDEKSSSKNASEDKLNETNNVKTSSSIKDVNSVELINHSNFEKQEYTNSIEVIMNGGEIVDNREFTDNKNDKKIEDTSRVDEKELLINGIESDKKIELEATAKVDKNELLVTNDKTDKKIGLETDLVLEKLLETKVNSLTDDRLTPQDECTTEESKDWLKSVLLPLTTKPTEKLQSTTSSSTVLPKNSWPSSDELFPAKEVQSASTVLPKSSWGYNDEFIPEKSSEKVQSTLATTSKTSWPSGDELIAEKLASCEGVECDKKKIELNSTLALLSPNLSVGTDSSMVSSFSSTPTFDHTKGIGEMSLSMSSTDGEDSQRVLVPSLKALASEVLRLHKKVLKPISDEAVLLSKKSLTLALDSSAVSKVPMPSPEDADKGTWKPAVGSQLLDLTSQSEHDLESDDLMTTSFIDGDNDQYNPDWESDTSDADSEDHSSSSGEFIWKDGDREETVKAKVATFSLQSQDDIADHQHGMARIDEEDEEGEGEDEERRADCDDDDDDNSSCGSTTEFVPSIWDKSATPTKSALRLAAEESKQDSLKKKRVCFKEQEYHCVYEYPGEPSDSEDDDLDDVIDNRKRNWETPSNVDYSCFADWELAEGDSVTDRDVSSAEDYAQTKGGSSSRQKKNDYDFYQLGAVDYDFTQMTTDDGEFFISSSARPFQGFSDVSSSEFFPGGRLQLDDEAIHNKDTTGATDNLSKEFISNEKLAQNYASPSTTGEQVGVGGLRHTREWLKLDLPATFSSSSRSSDRPASFSAHASAAHEAKLSKSQSSDFPTTSRSADLTTTVHSSDLKVQNNSESDLKETPKLSDQSANISFNSSEDSTNFSYKPPTLQAKSSAIPESSELPSSSKPSEDFTSIHSKQSELQKKSYDLQTNTSDSQTKLSSFEIQSSDLPVIFSSQLSAVE
ncbi:uncharacterized protein LOC111046846 isoform X2 [Nilaparvata lugens]|uniref:uncharacterized protein LOC111046846 isoform X2 n=1 Tax=Nilaparvata lugens TaxID=108931 RepID=UPI00193D526C|nr:uncharacterized protein LOC111046846 isoform X2 [Nilaparvata lugens]